jgi:C-terminal processing protease CtpA/Prc
MNIVFKEWETKALKLLISTISLSLSLALPVSAMQCSTLTLPTFEHNNKKHVVLLTAHNGKSQSKRNMYKPRKVVNAGEKSYSLSPGKHSLILAVTPSLSNGKWTHAMRYANRNKTLVETLDAKTIIVQIDTKANYAYQLLVSSTGEQTFKVNISEQSSICQLEDDINFQAQSQAESIDELPSIQLPKLMDYRLNQVMTKIADFHLTNKKIMTFANFLPTVSHDVFGLVVDHEFENKGTAIKVLSVQPYSIASKLSLLSGDRITHLGKIKVSEAKGSPTGLLKEFLAAIYIGKKVKIKLIRNGEAVDIAQTFIPLMVPAASYQLTSSNIPIEQEQSLRTYNKLSAELNFEYNQLMLEIFDFMQSKAPELDAITINHQAKVNRRFGLAGAINSAGNPFGLTIETIDIDSTAEQIGLQKGDVLVNINGRQFTRNNIKQLLPTLATLPIGVTFSITVERMGQLITLQQKYQPVTFVAYNLTIDLASKLSADLNVISIGIVNRKKRLRNLRIPHNQTYDSRSPENKFN